MVEPGATPAAHGQGPRQRLHELAKAMYARGQIWILLRGCRQQIPGSRARPGGRSGLN